jgi:hypothetical protein
MLIGCEWAQVEATLEPLREAGTRECECVVLWLGRRVADTILIESVYHPHQTARADVFRIPPTGMTALQAVLRRDRVMVAAQIHSHPALAFHSAADDRWAIVRHEGALSLVVPNFARGVSAANFLDLTKIYRFSSAARWVEVPHLELPACLRVS